MTSSTNPVAIDIAHPLDGIKENHLHSQAELLSDITERVLKITTQLIITIKSLELFSLKCFNIETKGNII